VKTNQKKFSNCQAPVPHACNPSCSGGRDQLNRSSKQAQANSLHDPYLEKRITKIELVKWPRVKAPVPQKKKKKSLAIN
jgi:hypothetical protein